MTRKQQIEKIKAKIIKHQKRIYELIQSCNHQFIRNGDSAICKECGFYQGWWCPDSKDGLCYYTENPDGCDFCGQPEERK